MSVQFGMCNFDGRPVEPWELDQLRPLLAPYGPDAEGCLCKDNFGILYRAFHTNKESRRESQPHISVSGAVITWDGRLDNRQQLISELAAGLPSDATDLKITASAYEQWGTASLAKFLGDWALSIWSPSDRSLILAKDFVGTRQLYYSVVNERVTWCSVLDPFLVRASHSLELDHEYVAGWLGFLPAPHLTPYVGICSVPPSCFVRLSKGTQTHSRYWDFDPAKKIRYRTDTEYEEHFRVVFGDAVRRRLRSDLGIVAELSGGMDSSSIVCMADTLIGGGGVETSRLDTVSYYDDSEPNWNERPYIAKVHEQRGRTGCVIDVGSRECLVFGYGRSAPTPAFAPPDKASEQFGAYILSHGTRVVLSGVGGDEMLGGVPTAVPELADLLAGGHFFNLARQLRVWALHKRKPWLHLLMETVREFLPRGAAKVPEHQRPAAWLCRSFVRRYAEGLMGYEPRLRLSGPAPSFQETLLSLESLRRQIAAAPLPSAPPYERRYPFLDRTLIEFVLSIPRCQLVRPGERRSLMRRALRGMVPDEVLNRRRKAYVVRAPLLTVSRHSSELLRLIDGMVCIGLDIVDGSAYLRALQRMARGDGFPSVQFIRTVNLENWLRVMIGSGFVTAPAGYEGRSVAQDFSRQCLPSEPARQSLS
ncbi:MAG: asparagine synthetase B family protein [Terracidiphilus sp.]